MNGWFLHLDSRDYLLRIVQHQMSFNCRTSKFLCLGCQDVHTMLIGLSCNSIHLDILPVKCWNVLQNRDFIIIDTQLSLTSFTSLLRLSYLNSCSVVIVLACYYYQDYIRDHSTVEHAGLQSCLHTPKCVSAKSGDASQDIYKYCFVSRAFASRSRIHYVP